MIILIFPCIHQLISIVLAESILSAFQYLTLSEVGSALKRSTMDLGINGADKNYGFGLIDLIKVYNQLSIKKSVYCFKNSIIPPFPVYMALPNHKFLKNTVPPPENTVFY